MKKLNVSEVSNVIGGTIKSCAVTYETAVAGQGTVCNKVTTCEGKFGGSISATLPVAASNCA